MHAIMYISHSILHVKCIFNTRQNVNAKDSMLNITIKRVNLDALNLDD